MNSKAINILEDPGGIILNSCLQRISLASTLRKARNIEMLAKCSNCSQNEYL